MPQLHQDLQLLSFALTNLVLAAIAAVLFRNSYRIRMHACFCQEEV
jgi:hypothetical protein